MLPVRISRLRDNNWLIGIHEKIIAVPFTSRIVINGTVTAEERQTIEGYLAWKWEFVGQLPVDHPYKEEPPNQPPAGMVIMVR